MMRRMMVFSFGVDIIYFDFYEKARSCFPNLVRQVARRAGASPAPTAPLWDQARPLQQWLDGQSRSGSFLVGLFRGCVLHWLFGFAYAAHEEGGNDGDERQDQSQEECIAHG